MILGVSSSPFLLNATVRFHLEKNIKRHEALVCRLVHSTCADVDSIISGAEPDEEVFQLYHQGKAIIQWRRVQLTFKSWEQTQEHSRQGKKNWKGRMRPAIVHTSEKSLPILLFLNQSAVSQRKPRYLGCVGTQHKMYSYSTLLYQCLHVFNMELMKRDVVRASLWILRPDWTRSTRLWSNSRSSSKNYAKWR